MVFKYKRKTSRGSWSEEIMQKAMDEAKTTTISAASKKYGIPIGTLHRHIKKGDATKKLGRFQPVFSKELEKKICELAVERDTLFYGLTKDSLQELAYDVAKLNNIPNPFKSKKAGRAWLEGFMRRHPQLTYRTPEPTALARCSAFNHTQVDRFYDNLWDVISQHQFLLRPDDIYNMDETGVKTSASRPPRVISTKGKRQVGVIATAEKGQLTTLICACSATGHFIPPCFIFGQRKRMNDRLLDGAPNGSQAWCSDSGWINNATFNNWLQIFIEKTRTTAEKPVLLILDNHTTHQNLEGLNLAREKHVIMVGIPPHTSHKLQPLDISVYRSFKVAFEQNIDAFQKNHPGRRVTQFDVARLVRTAYEKSATVQNATSGFRKAGIFPFNRNLFTDLDFAPAYVYENAAINENDPANERVTNTEDTDAGADETVDSAINSDKAILMEKSGATLPPRNDVIEDRNTTDTDLMVEAQQAETVSDLNAMTFDKPSTSYLISPKKILPSPKVTPTIKKRKVRCQKSEILTSSPFKATIEQKELKKKPKLVLQHHDNKAKGLGKGKGVGKGKGKGKGKENEGRRETEAQITEETAIENVFCLFCGEQYVEPPSEDWLQCPSCYGWAHELCTDTEDGSLLCTNCNI